MPKSILASAGHSRPKPAGLEPRLAQCCLDLVTFVEVGSTLTIIGLTPLIDYVHFRAVEDGLTRT